MNRNTNNRFANTPMTTMPRSVFEMPQKLLTTTNVGMVTPIYLKEIIPGETVTVDMASAIRMSTPVFPVMDDCYADFYFFFEPNRLVYEKFRQFMGEDKTYDYEQTPQYEIPYIKAPAEGWAKGTIADYYGIPINVPNLEVNALPFRGYADIMNEWFRPQDITNKLMINYDETILTGKNDGDPVEIVQLGGKPFKASKFHDLFTSALPLPQKGEPVSIPLSDNLDVFTSSTTIDPSKYDAMTMKFATRESYSDGFRYITNPNIKNFGISLSFLKGDKTTENLTYEYDHGLVPINLKANTSDVGISVNDLRNALAVQRYSEQLARGGSRYREICRSMFGVTSPDARMQIPEYLGGSRIPINVDQVVQTSETTENSPQGNVAAYSLTNSYNSVFTKSFTEHGYLHGLMVIRTNHTYQQGLEKHWSKRNLFDYYFPVFANIGEQPIYNREIFAQGTDEDKEVFGYQEPWYEHRYMPNRVSGAFRSTYTEGTLDSWHYADHYTECPRLSTEWLEEGTENMDRTLAVSSEIEDQFICDFKFMTKSVIPLPIYSIPSIEAHF